MLIESLVVLAGTVGQVTDEVEARRAEISADAATRTSLRSNERAGLLQGGDAVRLGGMLQIRYTANFRDGQGAEEDYTGGFSLSRARITAGADLNETWSVFLQGSYSEDGGEFSLLDAWADWKLDDRWMLRLGQFKVPSTREWQIDESKQLAADRSVVNSVFSAGRTQGVAAVYMADEFMVIGAFDDGAGTMNTDFNSPDEADYAFTGRGDWLFAGDWSQLADFQGWKGQETAGQLGGFIHFQDGGGTGAG